MGQLFVRKRDKKTLSRLAIEFGEDFLKRNQNGSIRIVGLYGASNIVLGHLKKLFENYFLEKEERVQIIFGEAPYKLNVGHFLQVYNNLGMNPHALIEN